MKMKKIILTLTIVFCLFSCSTDDSVEAIAEVQTSNETQVLEFASIKEMEAKIEEVKVYNDAVEGQLVAKYFTPNQNVSIDNAANKSLRVLSDDLKDNVLEELYAYHSAKLEAIYESRRHFNSTSIQSLADEINSLRLINPDAADKLLKDYSEFIVMNGYLAKARNYDYVSSILEPNGKILIDGVELVIEELQNKENANRSSEIILNQGWVTSGYDDFLVVTFNCSIFKVFLDDYNYSTNQPGVSVIVKNALAGYVRVSPGNYVLYPCYFAPNSSTNNANYGVNLFSETTFPTGYSSSGYDYDTKWEFFTSLPNISSAHGVIGGDFYFPTTNGQILTVSGVKYF